jgi:hypothetical protein
MGCKSAMESFLTYFDQFGKPAQMQYQLRTNFQTILGGLLSFIIYFIYVAIICYLYADLEAKNNYIVTTYNNNNPDPPIFEFSSDQTNITPENLDRGYFFYAFKIYDELTSVSVSKTDFDKVFYLEALDLILNKTNGVTTTLGQYELIPCEDMYPDNNYTQIFQNKILESALCLNSTLNTVQGDFVSNFYRFMSFKIKDCSGSVLTSKPKCANATQIAYSKKNWNIIFLYSDYKLGPTKIKESPIYYVISKMSLDIASLIYQKYDVYLGYNKLISYDNLYNTFSETTQQTIISVNQIVKHEATPGKSYIALYLRSDYDYVIYERRFKSFMDLLSQIGGIWKVVFLIGAFIMVPLNAKLLNVAISNDLYNLIPPEKTKKVESQNYKYLSTKSTRANPNKIIVAYGKNPLESKMAINYYKYERNTGMRFDVKEAFFSIFLMCCKTDSIKSKEKIFLDSENRIYERLNISTILNFSKQMQLMKRALVGNKQTMVEYSHKYTIFWSKLDMLKKKFEKYEECKDYHPVDLALIKEKYFISGIRAMKNKLGGLQEKVDVNLIELFDFNKVHLAKYFLPHLHILENKYPGLKDYITKNDDDDDV